MLQQTCCSEVDLLKTLSKPFTMGNRNGGLRIHLVDMNEFCQIDSH